MRRRYGHMGFGVVAVACALVAVSEGLRLQHASRINAEIAAAMGSTTGGAAADDYASAGAKAPTAAPDGNAGATTPAAAPGASPGASAPTPAPDSNASATAATAAPTAARSATPATINASPEARLARAVVLSKTDYDGALAAYKAIIQGSRSDLRQVALYDLGNLHLRQALAAGLDDEAQSLPLTELAKQSYRDLLRKDPMDWDARYNLERALRIAPEEDDESGAETGPPNPKERQRSTIADPRMDLP